MGILRHILRARARRVSRRRHADEIAQTVEHLVDAVDPRLRYVPDYREKLGAVAWPAIKHVRYVVNNIAGPVECSAAAWAEDARLRAMFASARDVSRIFSGNHALRDFLEGPEGIGLTHCYVALGAILEERKILGMEMRGEVIQRDVPQITVSFSDFRFSKAAAGEDGLRDILRGMALDSLARQAAARIDAMLARRKGLEQEQAILKTRLRVQAQRAGGMESLFENGAGTDAAEMQRQLNELERSLQAVSASAQTLEHYLQQLKHVLAHPAEFLALERRSLHLNSMNVLSDGGHGETAQAIDLSEIRIAGRPSRIVLVAKFPREELLARGAMLDEEARYLA